jgi:hypothetical protein
MTPENKAKELFEALKYRSPGTLAGAAIAKDHAIFCVDQIIDEIPSWEIEVVQYWEKVKTALNSL